MLALETTDMAKRVRFFFGQLLTAADFEAEQTYHMEMRRLHNRSLHGVGIVEGLRVSDDDTQSGGVVVSPGFALDGFGNEIVVDRPVRLDVGPCGKEICFVTLRYTEMATDPILTANGSSEFSRVTEGFSVTTAADDPGQDGSAKILSLARLIWQSNQWFVDESYSAKSAHKGERAFTPTMGSELPG
jgi:hypothetical protein